MDPPFVPIETQEEVSWCNLVIHEKITFPDHLENIMQSLRPPKQFLQKPQVAHLQRQPPPARHLRYLYRSRGSPRHRSRGTWWRHANLRRCRSDRGGGFFPWKPLKNYLEDGLPGFGRIRGKYLWLVSKSPIPWGWGCGTPSQMAGPFHDWNKWGDFLPVGRSILQVVGIAPTSTGSIQRGESDQLTSVNYFL